MGPRRGAPATGKMATGAGTFAPGRTGVTALFFLLDAALLITIVLDKFLAQEMHGIRFFSGAGESKSVHFVPTTKCPVSNSSCQRLH